MIKKIIASLLTGFLIILALVVIIGIAISGVYSFVFQIAFWLSTEPRFIVTILILIALVLSCFIFDCIADKD